MTGQPFRLASGGLIDRSRPLSFSFDGHRYQGYAGDTLAAALLANGVRIVGRSFKYHRPRGVFGAGSEEPNALVQLRAGGRTEPNLKSTQVEVFAGLSAVSQNCWPSVEFDLAAVAGWFSRILPAGFYYKTFMWPPKTWMAYERFIRSAAGLGKGPTLPDPDHYEQRFAHADALVVGGGPAGLAAALAAGRAGARVILADEQADFGGRLRADGGVIDGRPAMEWVAATVAELSAMTEVTLLRRSTVFGYYDDNLLAIAERVADHLPEPPPRNPRQRLWRVRARQVVLATGAIERPFVFADNDRPGIMLASAARAYVNQYAVKPGSRAVVFTNNDSGIAAALDLEAGGIEVAAIVDPRAGDGGPLAARARASGIDYFRQCVVVAAEGGRRLAAVQIMRTNRSGEAVIGGPHSVDCDLLCVSGGWTPTVHLFSQSGGKLTFDPAVSAFVPGQSKQAERSAGAAKGDFALTSCLAGGLSAGASAAAAAGFCAGKVARVPAVAAEAEAAPGTSTVVPLPAGRRVTRFVDLQNDVTAEDLALAVREGYASIEHAKRYTTLGMGTDQGKTSNMAGFAIVGAAVGADEGSVGTTTFRPPYTPVTFGILAGRETGRHFDPIRRTPMHEWHERMGAAFVPAGLWLRAQYYARPGEILWDAIYRETVAVRTSVAMVDVSPLGKIDIQGEDAGEFLNRVYINGFAKLEVGRSRYGVMLREDGIVYDDGTTSRLADRCYLMTTTTVNAIPVMRHLEYYSQVVWPELDVKLISVTDEWAAMALAGPNARKVLEKVAGFDVSNPALPFMAHTTGKVAGHPARIFRISFSGELAYEINVPADFGLEVWEAVMEAGKPFAIAAYGTEALSILRIEKGHVVGGEINGRTSAADLGFARMISKQKDFIGRRSLARPVHADPERKQLVGLVPADGNTHIPRGAQIVANPRHPSPNPMIGEITSSCYSPNLKKPIALGIVANGRMRLGETLHAVSPLAGKTVAVTVTHPVFIDPDGKRLHG